jgi:hypothetical protein
VQPVRLVHHQGMNRTDGQADARGWTADDSTFGARLALIRQHEKWGNVREAAIACGIPTETWRTWERDHVLPRNYAEVCQRISEACGADEFWLLTGSRTSAPPPLPAMTPAKAHRPNPQRPRPKPRPKAARTSADAFAA